MCAPFSWNAFLAPSLPPLFRLTPLRPHVLWAFLTWTQDKVPRAYSSHLEWLLPIQ